MHCPCHTFRPNGDIIENANEVLEVRFEGEAAFITSAVGQTPAESNRLHPAKRHDGSENNLGSNLAVDCGVI